VIKCEQEFMKDISEEVWKRKYLVSACTDSAAAVESDAAGVTGKE
jgi:hypothetical protein